MLATLEQLTITMKIMIGTKHARETREMRYQEGKGYSAEKKRIKVEYWGILLNPLD